MQIFTTNHQDIDSRLDCNYYQPKYIKLEKQIAKKTNKTLGDYVLSMAGGATPNKKFANKYYVKSADDGVPFLRVQNVANEGLNFDNCRYINQKTHQGLLKRSQIKEDYLITKITGVGRMAISSVAPKGFEGNINQHLVAIKTENRKISIELATFLNSDIGEELASRRSTGGTRPALDYKALRSIPVMLNPKIVSIMQSAYETREEKLKQADELLNSIDGYVRQQLGVDYTELEEKKTYPVNAESLQNRRHDPYYYEPNFIELEETLLKNKAVRLGILLKSITNGLDYRKFSEDGTLDYLRVSNIKPYEIDYSDVKKVRLSKADISKNIFGKRNDVLLTRKGTYGISVSLEENLNALISSEVFLLKIDTEKINSRYLSLFLNSSLGQKQFLRNKVGAIMGSLSQEAVKDTFVIIPSENKQLDIVNQVDGKILKASQLLQQAKKIVEDAKRKVEEMILN